MCSLAQKTSHEGKRHEQYVLWMIHGVCLVGPCCRTSSLTVLLMIPFCGLLPLQDRTWPPPLTSSNLSVSQSLSCLRRFGAQRLSQNASCLCGSSCIGRPLPQIIWPFKYGLTTRFVSCASLTWKQWALHTRMLFLLWGLGHCHHLVIHPPWSGIYFLHPRGVAGCQYTRVRRDCSHGVWSCDYLRTVECLEGAEQANL